MRQKSNKPIEAIAQTFICLFFILLVNLSCKLPNRFSRSYEPQRFDSPKWRSGDALTRGTMFIDLFTKRKINGKTREEVLELLGAPDKKSTNSDYEIWHYRVEFAGENPTQYFPVTFDKNGKAGLGTTIDSASFLSDSTS